MTTTVPAHLQPLRRDREAVRPERRLFTVEEFYALDQAGLFHPEERIELLDGEIIVMATDWTATRRWHRQTRRCAKG